MTEMEVPCSLEAFFKSQDMGLVWTDTPPGLRTARASRAWTCGHDHLAVDGRLWMAGDRAWGEILVTGKLIIGSRINPAKACGHKSILSKQQETPTRPPPTRRQPHTATASIFFTMPKFQANP